MPHFENPLGDGNNGGNNLGFLAIVAAAAFAGGLAVSDYIKARKQLKAKESEKQEGIEKVKQKPKPVKKQEADGDDLDEWAKNVDDEANFTDTDIF